MFKRSILLGAVSGLLAGIASIVYQKVYAASLGYDFAMIAQPVAIFAASMLGGLVAGILFFFLNRWLKARGEVVFNFFFVILSFVSMLLAFAMKLPLEVEMPELFPGLVVPMHFFPALAWFTLKPLFIRSYDPYQKVFN